MTTADNATAASGRLGDAFYLYTVSLVAATGGFLFGYDLSLISGAVIFLKQEWALSPAWFSPDCFPNSHGGDGKPYARQLAKTNPVLTWDYSATEGEGTVSPRCRIERMFNRRREELAIGCYSGGIAYNSGIPSPVDPRSSDAVNNLFNRFYCK
jgi:hypothetical protein